MFWAAPALADTTAVYSLGDGRMTMTIEISANGDVRGEMGGKMLDELRARVPEAMAPSFITRGGEGYFIQPGPDGIVVIRATDAAAEMVPFSAGHNGEFPKADSRDLPKFVALGPVTIHGRTGIAYGVDSEKTTADRSSIVLSADPDLAELRNAMAGQFAMSVDMARIAGFGNAGSPMIDLLKTGAPLRFAGMELIQVTHTPIASSRFELPAPPATREQVRALMVRKDAGSDKQE